MTFLNDFFGMIIRLFCNICGNNYALGIMLFTIIVNVIFLPLNIKQQKTMAKQARLKNKLDKLKEKYGNDQKRYQEEMSKLYSDTGASPFSGCLLMFIRLPIFVCIYTAIREILTYVYMADMSLIKDAAKVLGLTGKENGYQLTILNDLLSGDSKLLAASSKYLKLKGDFDFDFNFFGIDLLDTPNSTVSLIWIIPILSFVTALLSSVFSMLNNKKTNPGANSGPTMGCMMLMMPLFSLWITFTVPGAVGYYWFCSNIVSTIIMVAMQKFFFPAKVIAETEAKEARKRRALEQQRINPPVQSDSDPEIVKGKKK